LLISSCNGRKGSIERVAQFLRAIGDKVMAMTGPEDVPEKQGTARPQRPVRNHAYSGLTAWVMAIMSELAYLRFEEEELSALFALPAELGKAVGRIPSGSEAQGLERLLTTRDNRDLRLLRAVLAAGGFELVGGLSDHGADTQGFVAVRRAGDDTDMAVVSFRGTENIRDWETNLRHSLIPADFPQPAGNESKARVHRGSATPSCPSGNRSTGTCHAPRDSLYSSPAIPLGAPWQLWGHRPFPTGARLRATPSERPVLATKGFLKACELPFTAWSIPWTPCPLCRPLRRDTVIRASGRGSGGHLPSTRCWKSATALFACGGYCGGRDSLFMGSTTRWTDGTISVCIGRSCVMTLPVCSDTVPSAMESWGPRAVSGPGETGHPLHVHRAHGGAGRTRSGGVNLLLRSHT